MTLGQKIETLLRENHITKVALGAAIGLADSSVITHWVKDRHRPDWKNLEALAEFFKKPLEYFNDDPKIPPFTGGVVKDEPVGGGLYRTLVEVIQVPIVGRAAASGIDYAPDEPPRSFTPFLLHGPQRGRLEALVVAGDSMEPTAPDGSFIILKSRDFFKSNNLAVVRVDGQVLLKRVVVHGESLTLECDNKKHKTIRHAAKQVEILATVHQIVIVREP